MATLTSPSRTRKNKAVLQGEESKVIKVLPLYRSGQMGLALKRVAELGKLPSKDTSAVLQRLRHQKQVTIKLASDGYHYFRMP